MADVFFDTEGLSECVSGAGVFTSYDGLRAEGTGDLDFLAYDERILELREPQVLKILPKLDGAFAAFVQKVDSKDKPLWILGRVSRIHDYNKRLGILGACVAVSNPWDGVDLTLKDTEGLFDEFSEKFTKKLQGRPLPETLGMFPRIPKKTVLGEYSVSSDFGIWFMDESTDLYSRTCCAATCIKFTPNLGSGPINFQDSLYA